VTLQDSPIDLLHLHRRSEVQRHVVGRLPQMPASQRFEGLLDVIDLTN
jgi:hypothetical protein